MKKNKCKAFPVSGLRTLEINQGMLFVYKEEGPRRFWMPDTYFNLDIIFLDKNLVIVAIEKNVPHHPGRKVPPPIYSTKTYRAKYVLEIKANSPVSHDMNSRQKAYLEVNSLSSANRTRYSSSAINPKCSRTNSL